MVIAPNGTFVGEPGYPRGNVKRSEPAFGDPAMVYLVGDNPNAPLCKDSQKSPSSQSASSPPLNAAPGAAVALRFQENGHVTLPAGQAGKAANRGDIFVYGTTQPRDNELFNGVHGVWTADGKGGDGRGVLLAKTAYDDGQCYQINGGAISTTRQKDFAHDPTPLMGADLWCQTDIRLPTTASDGQLYTLYWVWEWPTQAGIDPGLPKGKNETYTTCMDVQISAGVTFAQKNAGEGFVEGQPIENAAVPAQFTKLGEPAAGPAPMEPNSASVSPIPAPTTSSGSILPTISPIPGPSASAVSPGSGQTTLLPIPGPNTPAASPTKGMYTSLVISAQPSFLTLAVVATTVSEIVTVTETVFGPVSATATAISPRAPKWRGRNRVGHWND